MKTFRNYLERAWYPASGWALALGFVLNCVVAPYLDISGVSWVLLGGSLFVLTGLKHYTDRTPHDGAHKEPKRTWIVVIGWALCIGFANNAIVNQFRPINTIDWIEMLVALTVLIGIGMDRDRRLNKLGKTYTVKQMWIVFTALVFAVALVCSCFVVPVLEYLVQKSVIKLSWTPVEIKWWFIVAGAGVVGGNEGFRRMFIAKAENRGQAITDTVQGAVDKAPDSAGDEEKTEEEKK